MAGILQSLIVGTETANGESMNGILTIDSNLEIAHHIGGKIITCQFIEQLVLVHTIGMER